MMQVRPGSRLQSVTSDLEVIVVKSPAGADVDLRCGGVPLQEGGAKDSSVSADPRFAGESVLGKRYADEGSGIEVLVTKGGTGLLSLGEVLLVQMEAKKLPSSD
jgi:hypothetical protein